MSSAPADEIDDVVQEVFYRFFRSISQYDSSIASIRTYLLQIASNLVYDTWRHTERVPQTTSLDEELGNLGDKLISQDVDLQVLEEAVRSAVAKIDDPLRTAVLNMLLDGADVAEICTCFHVKPHFVYEVRLKCIELVRQIAVALSQG